MKQLAFLLLCSLLVACVGSPGSESEMEMDLAAKQEPEQASVPQSDRNPRPLPAPASGLRPGVAPESTPEPAFRPLFIQGIEDWIPVNSAPGFFTYSGGRLDVTGDRGWLRSPRQYTDFVLRLEFRFVEPGSDSGIFLRTGVGTNFILGWPGDSYQVQVRDISEDPVNPLPLGQVYRHVVPEGDTVYDANLVADSYTGVGAWQHYEITVVGDLLTVRLNGQLVTTARDLDNPTGYIGFQSERGAVQFRNVEIYEL